MDMTIYIDIYMWLSLVVVIMKCGSSSTVSMCILQCGVRNSKNQRKRNFVTLNLDVLLIRDSGNFVKTLKIRPK